MCSSGRHDGDPARDEGDLIVPCRAGIRGEGPCHHSDQAEDLGRCAEPAVDGLSHCSRITSCVPSALWATETSLLQPGHGPWYINRSPTSIRDSTPLCGAGPFG